jgi:hypothetical protein
MTDFTSDTEMKLSGCGHSILFTPGVATHVPFELCEEALRAGLTPLGVIELPLAVIPAPEETAPTPAEDPVV